MRQTIAALAVLTAPESGRPDVMQPACMIAEPTSLADRPLLWRVPPDSPLIGPHAIAELNDPAGAHEVGCVTSLLLT